MITIDRARLVVTAVLLGVVFSGAAPARSPREFEGQWVFKLGERSFMLLDLKTVAEASGPLQGGLVRPRRFGVANGLAISRIELPIVRFPVVHSSVDGELLRVALANPEDPGEETEFEFRVTGDARGSLAVTGVAMEPWPFARVAGPVAVATDWCLERTYRPEDSDVPNAEMARIFEADQGDRIGHDKIDWAVVGRADSARRAATRALLDTGALRSSDDYRKAAFVFQHGDVPEDYLLAHTLAMVAVAKGSDDAIWIASATLDRYLQSIGKPQVYGTQFSNTRDGKSTQEPYDRALVSDALRRHLGVPSLAEQEKQRKQYESGSR